MFGDYKKAHMSHSISDNGIEEENRLLKKQMQKAMELIEKQSQEIRKTHSEISILRTDNNQLKTSINPKIETSINDKDEEIRFLRQDNGKMASDIQLLKDKNNALLNDNKKLINSIQQNENGIDIIEIDLKKQIKSLEKKIKEIEKNKSTAYISLERKYITSNMLLKESLNELEKTIQAFSEAQDIGKVIGQANEFSKKVQSMFKKPKKDIIKKISEPITENGKIDEIGFINVKKHTESIDFLNRQILDETSRGIKVVKNLVDVKG